MTCKLYQTDDSTITLVSCVPRLVYDHRLLVTRQAGRRKESRLIRLAVSHRRERIPHYGYELLSRL